ncbi:hypothetical protein PsYK624_154140 [Phanerochaete sordida]|uniref:Uncharacterized protein n=1 Tax=Phanerochaete sordida TaxID=48140 RepID=A0A9P3GP73_9APHY|nr:hypothetical protein PsYK624_154140 [Phanerochaete sordida]
MRIFSRLTYQSRLPTKSLVQTNAEIIPAAHRLPQEIFKNIIDNALPEFPTLCRANDKQVFGQYSMVCRYWAIHTREPLFAHLKLCSRDDAKRLLEFAKITTLGMNIGIYVQEIRLRLTIPSFSPPWAHLVLHLLPCSLFPNLKEISVKLSQNPTLSDEASLFIAPRTPFSDLPRSIPFSASQGVEYLSVNGLHFSTLAHLAIFIASFRKPGYLNQFNKHAPSVLLDGVTWEDGNALAAPQLVPLTWTFRGPPEHFPSVGGSSITPWRWLELFPTRSNVHPMPNAHSARLSHTPQILDRDEMHHIYVILQKIFEFERTETKISDILRGHETSLTVKPDYLSYCVAESGTIRFSLNSTGHVAKIWLQFPALCDYDCTGVDTALLALPDIETHVIASLAALESFDIVIERRNCTKHQCAAVRARMPRLAAQGKLVVEWARKPLWLEEQLSSESNGSQHEEAEEAAETEDGENVLPVASTASISDIPQLAQEL